MCGGATAAGSRWHGHGAGDAVAVGGNGSLAAVDWFWRTIAAADRDRERLRELLMSSGKDEVYAFQDIFIELAVELRDEPYTFYLAAGESEDGLEDITNWVVSQGRERYQAVVDEPRLMPAEIAVELLSRPVDQDLYAAS